MIRSVEIKGPTVALLVHDDAIAAAPNGLLRSILNAARVVLAKTAPGPSDLQRAAWKTLAPGERTKARDACTANVPSVLTIEDGKWSVRRG